MGFFNIETEVNNYIIWTTKKNPRGVFLGMADEQEMYWLKSLQHQAAQKDRQIADLHVIIDTLQTNLRSASSYIPEEKKKEVETQSYLWSINWRPEGS